MATENANWLMMGKKMSALSVVWIRSFSNLQVTRTGIISRTNFGQIRPLPADLGALVRLKKNPYTSNGTMVSPSSISDWIFVKIVGNKDRHKISDECNFGEDRTIHFGVTCP